MFTLQDAVNDFLGQSRIAVAGVSRNSGEAANAIYRKLRDHGYTVFPINPNAGEVEGDKCYPTVSSIPGGVDGVIFAAPPEAASQIVRDCAEVGVSRVWMHRSFGNGSVNEEAVAYGREHHMTIIPGGCPMMFLEPDFGHKCMRWWLQMTGSLPAELPEQSAA